MTNPDPGFVPLSERFGEVKHFLMTEWERAADEALPSRAAHITDLLATIDDAIEALQMGEMDSSQDLAPAVGSPLEWRPIESAPRTGEEMFGYRPDQGVFVFRWAWMEEFVPKDQNGDPTEDYDDAFSCWWHDRWEWMEGELTPTHWRPLPAPPTTAKEPR